MSLQSKTILYVPKMPPCLCFKAWRCLTLLALRNDAIPSFAVAYSAIRTVTYCLFSVFVLDYHCCFSGLVGRRSRLHSSTETENKPQPVPFPSLLFGRPSPTPFCWPTRIIKLMMSDGEN